MEVLETIEKVFGHNMTKYRDSLGISQDDMAHRLGIPESTYKRWEQGRAMPDSKHRQNLRKAGVPITILFLDPDLTKPSDEQILARITEIFNEKKGPRGELTSLFGRLSEEQAAHFLKMMRIELRIK